MTIDVSNVVGSIWPQSREARHIKSSLLRQSAPTCERPLLVQLFFQLTPIDCWPESKDQKELKKKIQGLFVQTQRTVAHHH